MLSNCSVSHVINTTNRSWLIGEEKVVGQYKSDR